MVRRLYFFAERVQRVSRGQLPQSVLEHLIEIALVLPMVDSRRPADTRMPLWAGRLLLVPINAKLTNIDTVLGVGLPLHIATRRTNHFDPLLLLEARPEWEP